MSSRFCAVEPLLAAWSDLGNRFSGRHAEMQWSDIATLISVILGGLGFVAVLYVLQLRQQRRAESNEPVHLFQDLCRLHDLGWKERRLLTRLARSLGLQIPAVLFVSPHLFDPEQLPNELTAHELALQKIADKLFAGLEEPISTMPARGDFNAEFDMAPPPFPVLTLPDPAEAPAVELA